MVKSAYRDNFLHPICRRVFAKNLGEKMKIIINILLFTFLLNGSFVNAQSNGQESFLVKCPKNAAIQFKIRAPKKLKTFTGGGFNVLGFPKARLIKSEIKQNSSKRFYILCSYEGRKDKAAGEVLSNYYKKCKKGSSKHTYKCV